MESRKDVRFQIFSCVVYQNTLKSDLPTDQIPINFSVEDLKTVDRWQVSQGAPLKVGVLLPTDLTIDNAGSWNTLPDGKRVWRLQVQAKDAIALMLSFRDFYIPENGKLFIYSSDKTHLISGSRAFLFIYFIIGYKFVFV